MKKNWLLGLALLSTVTNAQIIPAVMQDGNAFVDPYDLEKSGVTYNQQGIDIDLVYKDNELKLQLGSDTGLLNGKPYKLIGKIGYVGNSIRISFNDAQKALGFPGTTQEKASAPTITVKSAPFVTPTFSPEQLDELYPGFVYDNSDKFFDTSYIMSHLTHIIDFGSTIFNADNFALNCDDISKNQTKRPLSARLGDVEVQPSVMRNGTLLYGGRLEAQNGYGAYNTIVYRCAAIFDHNSHKLYIFSTMFDMSD